ncbi:hypothetical protein QJS10_CPB18g00468 [Acorus calamus]|uniref:Uncharacterized protein n=1 Tax=Acorus calamus TaxID=4465 RepID=A0AAV9CN28_ACOCL|nr:hypothetical protein QJS10_CPB18g00468 [Acorus calamus]
MTVFSGVSGGGRQVFPVDYGADVSQRLVEAAHGGDPAAEEAEALIADPLVDVNFAGAVVLKSRRAEIVPRGESPAVSRTIYEELRTDVSPLFLAAHIGNFSLLRKLINAGADVNQKLFRGHAAAAAAREGHEDVLEVLIRAGASREACEEALVEAAQHARSRLAQLLMDSEMIRPRVAVHALVTAACHGHVDVVDTLMKCNVNANATDRVLIRSSKPSLHANVDCTALFAAIVSRQISVVHHLLQAGVRRDIKASLGAWSWDPTTAEEFRVGAGLAEPYGPAWCAVEYFESTGTILQSLLRDHPIDSLHLGRTLLHHAVLCENPHAIGILLESGADPERGLSGFRPVHLAARLGSSEVLQRLIKGGCDVNSMTDAGETALMLCARYGHGECLGILASTGADFGLKSLNGASVESIADLNQWSVGFKTTVLEAIRSGVIVCSSDATVFSPLAFVTKSGDNEALRSSIKWPGANLNERDKHGVTPLMIAVTEGHIEAFRTLIFAGADAKLANCSGETALSLAEQSHNRDGFEKAMLEFTLCDPSPPSFTHALHHAAREGDADSIRLLATQKKYDVNAVDGEGRTPLMLAAREGHVEACGMLISLGARCDRETVAVARGKAREVVMDEVGRGLVVGGGRVRKYMKNGKGGRVHWKWMGMVVGKGVLRWGSGGRRNVVCEGGWVGGSEGFRKNRWRRGEEEEGVFGVVTREGREVHFVSGDGRRETAEMWVRGIRVVTREALGKVI